MTCGADAIWTPYRHPYRRLPGEPGKLTQVGSVSYQPTTDTRGGVRGLSIFLHIEVAYRAMYGGLHVHYSACGECCLSPT